MGNSINFLVGLKCVDRQQEPIVWYFMLSQIIIFLYLGFDDRFLIHELAGRILGINDAYLLLFIGCIEAMILMTLGQIWQQSRKALVFLGLASILFLIMIVIDAKFPAKMQFRLSLEELAKLWASLFLCLFAWEILMQRIHALKVRP